MSNTTCQPGKQESGAASPLDVAEHHVEKKHRPAQSINRIPFPRPAGLPARGAQAARTRRKRSAGKVTLPSPRARLRWGRLRLLGRQRRRAPQLPRKDMPGAPMATRRLPPRLGLCVPRCAQLLRCTALGATGPQPRPSPHPSATRLAVEGVRASPLLWAGRRVRAAGADCFPEPGLARSVRGPRGGGRPNPQGH